MSRIRDFCLRHRPGQVVRARVLRRLSPRHAVLRIHGVELTALMTNVPEPGSVRAFRITSLTPDIVLQELPAGHGLAGSGDLHPAEATVRLKAALQRLESALTYAGAWPDPDLATADDPAELHRLYQERLAASKTAQAAEADVQNCLAALSHGSPKPDYRPWLTPLAQGQELVVAPADDEQAIARVFCTFHDPAAGDVELTLMAGNGQASYRARTAQPPATDLERLALWLAQEVLRWDGPPPRRLPIRPPAPGSAPGAYTLLATGGLESLSYVA